MHPKLNAILVSTQNVNHIEYFLPTCLSLFGNYSWGSMSLQLGDLQCIIKEHDIKGLDSLNNILTEYFQTKKKKATLQDVVQRIENRAENNKVAIWNATLREYQKKKPTPRKEYNKSDQDKEVLEGKHYGHNRQHL
ncbi:hypothetical protein BY458DRAFT_495422 [Sporodiniella umbellata]|nr:hypothetical protein BY458DRAFT_495422 [Sporodiniella umbellata]